MNITIDANILFAALIKGGETRKILTRPGVRIFAPAFIFVELIKYKPLILQKSDGSDDELNYLIAILLKNISPVSNEELLPFTPAAKTLTSDVKDVFYFACALYKDTVIWSNDKEFKKQSRVKVFSTKELIDSIDSL